MRNPWKSIELEKYEAHMRLDSVLQLQTLNRMMAAQLSVYPAASVMILGIAGGNGLEHIHPQDFSKVYGVDINEAYLNACSARYPRTTGHIRADLCGFNTGIRRFAARRPADRQSAHRVHRIRLLSAGGHESGAALYLYHSAQYR